MSDLIPIDGRGMSIWDDEAGYDRDDPKHPDWAEAMADRADMERKREKENRAAARVRLPDGCELYHDAPAADVEAILRDGLRPGPVVPRGVYLWYRLSAAQASRFHDEVVLAVDVGGLEVEDDPLAPALAACYYRGLIPADRIRRYDPGSRGFCP